MSNRIKLIFQVLAWVLVSLSFQSCVTTEQALAVPDAAVLQARHLKFKNSSMSFEFELLKVDGVANPVDLRFSRKDTAVLEPGEHRFEVHVVQHANKKLGGGAFEATVEVAAQLELGHRYEFWALTVSSSGIYRFIDVWMIDSDTRKAVGPKARKGMSGVRRTPAVIIIPVGA